MSPSSVARVFSAVPSDCLLPDVIVTSLPGATACNWIASRTSWSRTLLEFVFPQKPLIEELCHCWATSHAAVRGLMSSPLQSYAVKHLSGCCWSQLPLFKLSSGHRISH